jgi:AcrR family transcriptional regulator
MAVKGRKSRSEQAAETRERIRRAAYRLFCECGYDDTTMQLVADEAGVAVQTVYFVFGTKARLLAEVSAHVVLGDAPAAQWRERPWARQMEVETDAGRLIDLFVDADTEIKGRIAPFVAAVGSALRGDEASDAERDRGRDSFFRSILERLNAVGALRKDLSIERALDIVRVVNTPEAFADLTMRRGWTTNDWSAWLKRFLRHELLAPAKR